MKDLTGLNTGAGITSSNYFCSIYQIYIYTILGRHHVHKRNSSANATSETKSSTEEKKTSLFSKNIKVIYIPVR